MKFLSVALLVCLLPGTILAQGVRMSADFLPLEVGNRWVYDVFNEDGRKIGDLDFAIQDYTILDGRSFYVFTRFPFSPQEGQPIRLIRYDRLEHQYARMADGEEGPLFLADGARAKVVEADDSGLPSKFTLSLDLMELTFQRGVGIVEAHIHGPNGIQIAKLTAAHVGERASGLPVAAQTGPAVPEPTSREDKPRELADNVTSISESNPVLDVRVVPVPDGDKFILNVLNTSDKLLPFGFKSGQSYDFAVIDSSTGQEIWRWSLRMFFTEVIRQEAILPNKSWSYEVTWNHLDNDLNPVTPGKYEVIGFVTTQPPLQSEPASFEIH